MRDDLTASSFDVSGATFDLSAPRAFRRFDSVFLPAMDVLALVLTAMLTVCFAEILSPVLFGRPFVPGFLEALQLRAPSLALLTAVALVAFIIRGHYVSRQPFWIEAKHIVAVCALLMMMDAFIQYMTRTGLSRSWLLSGWAFAPIALILGRAVARKALDALGLWRIPTIVVGAGERAAEITEALRMAPELGFAFERSVSMPAMLEMAERRCAPDDLPCARRMAGVRDRFVILAPEASEMQDLAAITRQMTRLRADFAIVPPLREVPVLGMKLHHFLSYDISLMTLHQNLDNRVMQAAKRGFDILVSLAALTFLAPLFLIVATLVKRDGGPAFFAHERIGRHGRAFKCLKFRSMVHNGQAVLERHLAENPDAADEWRRTRKLTNDPRITAFGRFLRKSSIDELPQLINVLRGDMSLVGPRPIVRDELQTYYGDDAHFYLLTRPGITGLWQVSGRSGTSYERRVQLDAWYVRNWSIWYDIAIMLRTVPAVLKQDGAR